uniref:Selenoprotein F n=1 Tax=Oncorhynchus tshawytscha TaxID=74940 RepID=A0A8C8GKC9_ONCTS
MTGTSCNKHSNWTVLSQSLHSKTQSWTLLLTAVAALRDVLLSLPSCPLCCCLCPTMFVPCFVLLPCCVAAMLLLCCCQLSAYGANLSSESCRELGFSSNLLCSSCDLLGEFSLSSIQPVCKQCCQQEVHMESRKLYPGAILEVFQGEFPDSPVFFIQYVRGADPILKLLDDNGNIAEELSILKWNTDSVEEFLSEKLEVYNTDL